MMLRAIADKILRSDGFDDVTTGVEYQKTSSIIVKNAQNVFLPRRKFENLQPHFSQ